MLSNNLYLSDIAEKVTGISRQYYGDHTLDAINGAGLTKQPKLALVFINPTHRNISSRKEWTGLKAPWIGCANIWQFLTDAGLIDESINKEIQKAGTNWSPDFAVKIYAHVASQGLYITNIVKWAGLDARLPERDKLRIYAPLLIEELTQVQPQRIIAFGQLTLEGLSKELGVKHTQGFSALNNEMLRQKQVLTIPTKIGDLIPCYFPVGQGIKNKAQAIKILELAHAIS